MPIVSLEIENFKRVRAVSFNPGGGVTELTGLNGAGKSSVLDAIKAALGGKEVIPWKPIRDGAEQATITIGVEGVSAARLKVIRKFRRRDGAEYTTDVIVESEEGARFKSPQTLLDTFIGALSFDPLKFITEKSQDQVETLRQFVTGVDFDEIDRLNAEDFEVRKDINRRAKDLRGREATVITCPDDWPTQEVDETKLIAELEDAGKVAKQIADERAQRAALTMEIKGLRDASDQFNARVEQARERIKQLKEEILRCTEQAATADARADEISETLAGIPEPGPEPDTTDIRRRIEEARTINDKVGQRKRSDAEMAKIKAEADALEKRAAELTAQIDARKAQKAKAIAESKLPIDGLGFEDGLITFNGQPLDQASQAEQIRVSVAIAAALNPKLKLAIIKDGSLLDRNSWALLEKFAVEHGLQVFVETVDSSRPTAIQIEDGEIAEVMEAAE